MTYYKKGSRKFLHGRLLLLLKEVVRKALSNFLLVHMIPQIIIKNFYIFLQQSVRISGKSINFDDKKINKSNFYKNKKLFHLHDIDSNKMF